jgi:predicted DNA-binding protein with PD1-like motif
VHAQQLTRADDGTRTFALIFDIGDEVAGELQNFAEQNQLGGSHFTAIGAFSDVVLAWFDWQTKEYRKIPINEQVEVLALVGDIAEADGKPKVHAHLVIGKSDGSAHGGHLIEAHVRPTLEVVLTESPQHLQRRFDPKTGLAPIRI